VFIPCYTTFGVATHIRTRKRDKLRSSPVGLANPFARILTQPSIFWRVPRYPAAPSHGQLHGNLSVISTAEFLRLVTSLALDSQQIQHMFVYLPLNILDWHRRYNRHPTHQVA
jgi:hypothetical protein